MDTKQKMKRALGWLLGRRWIFWALAAVIALLMACVAVYLAWRGFRLLTSEGLGASDTAAGIQGLAAAVNLLATLCLVGVTTAYAFIAYKHLRLSGPDVTMECHLARQDPINESREPMTASIDSLSSLPSSWHREWMLAVSFVNSGNEGTSVVRVSLVPDVGPSGGYSGSELSQPCPIYLAPHSSETLYFDHEYMTNFLGVMKAFTRTNRNPDVRVRSQLGSGTDLSSQAVALSVFQMDNN